MRDVGDAVGRLDDLRLEQRPQARIEIARAGVIVRRDVLGDGLAHFPGQVQAAELRVAALEDVHHAQAVEVVLEAAVPLHQLAERVLAGVAERRVPQVVRERHGLGQVLVQVQEAGDRAGDLRHLDRVRQPRAVMVSLVVDEHLRLVLQAAEGGRVDHALAVALVGRAERVLRLVVRAPARAPAAHRVSGQLALLAPLDLLAVQHGDSFFHSSSSIAQSSSSACGMTLTEPTVVTKFVSPDQRGTTCR